MQVQRSEVHAPPRSAVFDALHQLVAEIAAATPILAGQTPARQRLALTLFIARARAIAETSRGSAELRSVDRMVHWIARELQRWTRIWWPGSVIALARRAAPRSAFTWAAEARRCQARLQQAPGWGDDDARTPVPYDSAAMFHGICEALARIGGPLADAERFSPAALDASEARAQLAGLERMAGELRWLRGAVPDLPWGAAIGRLRGIAHALGGDGDQLRRLLDPTLSPPGGWARHLGRDPEREAMLATVPSADVCDAELQSWLVRAFEVFDSLTLASLCGHLDGRLAALSPNLGERRHRRRVAALLIHLHAQDAALAPVTVEREDADARVAEVPYLAEVRALVSGRRALFVGNRSAPEIEQALRDRVGLACEAVAAVDNPRRRQSLVRRIRGGAYDIVLVAHEFSAHADTEQLAEACRHRGVVFCAVGKGRFARVIASLYGCRNHAHLKVQVHDAPRPRLH